MDAVQEPHLNRATAVNAPPGAGSRSNSRKWVHAELNGNRVHTTLDGQRVNVWVRAGKYIARGYYDGRQFGEKLGEPMSPRPSRGWAHTSRRHPSRPPRPGCT